MHTHEQLAGGVRDFCFVLDQAAIAFFWEWKLLPRIRTAGVDVNLSFEAVRNATIENALVSIRTLDEFFSEERCRATDIRAKHYPHYRSPGAFLSPDERVMISRRVAHLTIDRSENPQTVWPVTELI